MRNNNFYGKGKNYDLHIHFDTHVGKRYSILDYALPIIEQEREIIGFVKHSGKPDFKKVLDFEVLYGIELRFPIVGHIAKGYDYRLAHVSDGFDILDLIDLIAKKKIDIIAHPLTQNTWCSDWEYLFEALLEHGIALEYNAKYSSDETLYQSAVNKGVSVSFGSDAHAPNESYCIIPKFVTPFEELKIGR